MHRGSLRTIFRCIGKYGCRKRARAMAYDLPEQRIARRGAIRRHKALPSVGNLAIGHREENNVGRFNNFCRIRISIGCRFLSRRLRVFCQQRTVSRNHNAAASEKLAERVPTLPAPTKPTRAFDSITPHSFPCIAQQAQHYERECPCMPFENLYFLTFPRAKST